MIFLSVCSFIAAIIYIYIGFTTFNSHRKSKLCRIFLYLTISMTIWSFSDGFLYLARNIMQYSFWNKIAAFGWCTFEALVLYFVLILTENKHAKKWYIIVLMSLPAFIFLFMVLFMFGPNINTSPMIENIFYIGNFLYNFSYLLLAIIFIFIWGYKSNSRIQKKQAFIIVISSLVPFFLNLIFQDILYPLNIIKLPNMGQIFTLIMILGVYYAIERYQFMSIPTAQITNELFCELSGLTFLTDSKGIIIKANSQAFVLLNFKESEIIGKHINQIVKHEYISKIMEDCESIRERIKLLDIQVLSNDSSLITINLSIIPLHTKTGLLRGILFIGEDIRATKWLEDEIEKHKLTNERLQNSEMLFRKMLEITPISIVVISKNTGKVVYLNAQAVELFGKEGSELIGTHVSEYLVNPEDKASIVDSLNINKKVRQNDIYFKRSDNSIFTGMITMISSIYHEEEVALSCVVDMTEQKRVEEMLKQNNDYIIKLNEELMKMNDNLFSKSIKDGLTNLYNHQYMNELLEKKLQEIDQTKEKLSLMMLDIDHFKRVNDEFGHQIGDQVLAAISDLIVKFTRDYDYIGRYGGEEFIVILPNTGINEAVTIAELIRTNIQDYNFGIQNLKVTICIGVAEYLGELPNALVNKADMLLYQAKYKGRNRVEMKLDEN